MSYLAQIKAVLLADGDLVALATGGIWTLEETGDLGLSRKGTPTAFDGYGRIQPTVLLKLRDALPDGQLRDDEAGKVLGVAQIVECWLYDHVGYAGIEAMAVRIFADLHALHLPGAWPLMWDGDRRPPIREPGLNANVQRSDYRLRYIRSA